MIKKILFTSLCSFVLILTSCSKEEVKPAIKEENAKAGARVVKRSALKTASKEMTRADQMVVRFYPVNASGSELIFLPLDVGVKQIRSTEGGGNLEVDVKQYIEAMGVQFPEGAYVVYLRGASRLAIMNTLAEHKRIKEIIKRQFDDAQKR